MRNALTTLAAGIFLFASCAHPPKSPMVEDLRSRQTLSSFTLQQIRGTRAGDRLDTETTFGDGSSLLKITMRFTIGAPTKLKAGTWQWIGKDAGTTGTVAERSVMFLGGQDGPPSVGGRFDLLDSSGVPQYRITIPTTELREKLPLAY